MLLKPPVQKSSLSAGDRRSLPWSSQGQSEAMVRVTAQLFDDVQSVIESKQLAPMLRTQARRSSRGHVQRFTLAP